MTDHDPTASRTEQATNLAQRALAVETAAEARCLLAAARGALRGLEGADALRARCSIRVLERAATRRHGVEMRLPVEVTS